MVFAEPDSLVALIGGCDTAAAMIENQPTVQAAFETGNGVAWGDRAGCLFCAVARMFRPGYVNALVQEWLPALDGGVDRLRAGAKVADVVCGHGISTILMAQETGLALGAQAGERRLAEVIRTDGFEHVRRVAETPLNMVLEAS